MITARLGDPEQKTWNDGGGADGMSLTSSVIGISVPRWEILDAIACSWYRGRFLIPPFASFAFEKLGGYYARGDPRHAQCVL